MAEVWNHQLGSAVTGDLHKTFVGGSAFYSIAIEFQEPASAEQMF